MLRGRKQQSQNMEVCAADSAENSSDVSLVNSLQPELSDYTKLPHRCTISVNCISLNVFGSGTVLLSS